MKSEGENNNGSMLAKSTPLLFNEIKPGMRARIYNHITGESRVRKILEVDRAFRCVTVRMYHKLSVILEKDIVKIY